MGGRKRASQGPLDFQAMKSFARGLNLATMRPKISYGPTLSPTESGTVSTIPFPYWLTSWSSEGRALRLQLPRNARSVDVQSGAKRSASLKLIRATGANSHHAQART